MSNKYKSICIINCYFGKLPEGFELWLLSCKYNPSIDFILFTDQNLNIKIKNVKIIKTSLKDIYMRISKIVRKDLNFNKPHKLCDFKPMYGEIFEEYLINYDVWGYCDLDMVFGNIRKFITDEILETYDKVYSLGHLSLYKNSTEVKRRIYQKSDKITFADILQTEITLGYDEINGIYNLYKAKGYSMYETFEFADISHRYKRFKLSTAYDNLENFNRQVFYWEDGRVFRQFIDNNEVKCEEFVYIHFQKRKLKILNELSEKSKIIISHNGFYSIDKKIIFTKEIINKFNKFNGIIYESIENFIFESKIIIKVLRRKFGRVKL